MGGGGERLPAAARRAARPARHARADAGAVRPARDAHRRAPASASPSFLRDIRAADPRRGCARPREGGEPGLAAEVRRAAGDYTRADEAVQRIAAATCSACSDDLRRRRAVDRARPPTPCCRCVATEPGLPAADRRRDRLARAPLRRLERRLLAARVRLRAGARARAGRARHALLLRGPDERARARLARPARAGGHRGRAGGGADRLADRRADLGRRAATRPRRPTATTTAARSTTSSRGTTAAAPYDHEAALALAREHAARVRRPRGAQARRLQRPSAAGAGLRLLRARHRAARPLVVRGACASWRRCSRQSARQRARARRRCRTRSSAHEPVSGRELAPSSWGKGKDLQHLGLAEGGRARLRRARAPSCRRVGGGRRRRSRAPRSSAPRASCWRSRRATGRSSATHELAADYPRAARWTATSPALHAALAALADSRSVPEPELRNLAPELDLSPLAARSHRTMRALILSWEYPPLIEGGLARHVRKLSENLVRPGRGGARAHARARGVAARRRSAAGVVVHRVREPQAARASWASSSPGSST